MTKKTLYIRVDSSPLPEEEGGVICLDYNLESYFCSHLGKTLCSGFKAKDGTPYYRLFQPGALVADYKRVDLNKYCSIIQQWENVLGELLHEKPDATKEYTFTLSKEYEDWLCHHDNEYYREVGRNLNGNIMLSAEVLYSDVISVLRQRLKRYLLVNKEGIDCIVCSDESVESSSVIIKELRRVLDIDFLPLDEWRKLLPKRMSLNKICSIHGLTLGKTSIADVKGTYTVYWDDELRYSYIGDHFDCMGKFNDTDCDSIFDQYVIWYNGKFPSTWTEYGFRGDLSYEELKRLFLSYSFVIKVTEEPHIVSRDGRKVLSAFFVAESADKRLSFSCNFTHGNRNGEGTSVNAKGSLCLIALNYRQNPS